MSVCLTCDHSGLADLTDAMRDAGLKAGLGIQATVNKSIVTLKRKSPTLSAMLVIKAGDETLFSLEGDDLVWTVSEEDRECVLARLKQCVVDDAFVPAELIRIQVPKNKKLDYLYAELTK